MYEAPVTIYETAMQTIMEERDGAIFAKIQAAFDVDVDREELIRALQYDRNQYDKGYADGKADAEAELVRCKDCDNLCPCGNGNYICSSWGSWTDLDGWCHKGERREGE